MDELRRKSSTPERLRLAMINSNIKQAELSRITGIPKGSISNYLAGRYEPKSSAIGKIAKALNVSEMWLWGYDVPMERTEGQKKNDQLIRLVTRMRKDEGFADMVRRLDELNPNQYESVKQILSAFTQK